MHGDRGDWERRNFIITAGLLSLVLLAGCFYRISRETPRQLTQPLQGQPVAVIPIPDAPARAGSGADLTSFIQDSLTQKGYLLIDPAVVQRTLDSMALTPPLLLSDRDSLLKAAERMNAKYVLIGSLPEYRVLKSSWGSQVMDRGVDRQDSFDSLSLPTYFLGKSEIRLVLRMFDSQTGSLVWMSEGRIRATGESAARFGRKVAERLLEDLPPLRPSLSKE